MRYGIAAIAILSLVMLAMGGALGFGVQGAWPDASSGFEDWV